jgi:hypothetical protein
MAAFGKAGSNSRHCGAAAFPKKDRVLERRERSRNPTGNLQNGVSNMPDRLSAGSAGSPSAFTPNWSDDAVRVSLRVVLVPLGWSRRPAGETGVKCRSSLSRNRPFVLAYR